MNNNPFKISGTGSPTSDFSMQEEASHERNGSSAMARLIRRLDPGLYAELRNNLWERSSPRTEYNFSATAPPGTGHARRRRRGAGHAMAAQGDARGAPSSTNAAPKLKKKKDPVSDLEQGYISPSPPEYNFASVLSMDRFTQNKRLEQGRKVDCGSGGKLDKLTYGSRHLPKKEADEIVVDRIGDAARDAAIRRFPEIQAALRTLEDNPRLRALEEFALAYLSTDVTGSDRQYQNIAEFFVHESRTLDNDQRTHLFSLLLSRETPATQKNKEIFRCVMRAMRRLPALNQHHLNNVVGMHLIAVPADEVVSVARSLAAAPDVTGAELGWMLSRMLDAIRVVANDELYEFVDLLCLATRRIDAHDISEPIFAEMHSLVTQLHRSAADPQQQAATREALDLILTAIADTADPNIEVCKLRVARSVGSLMTASNGALLERTGRLIASIGRIGNDGAEMELLSLLRNNVITALENEGDEDRILLLKKILRNIKDLLAER